MIPHWIRGYSSFLPACSRPRTDYRTWWMFFLHICIAVAILLMGSSRISKCIFVSRSKALQSSKERLTQKNGKCSFPIFQHKTRRHDTYMKQIEVIWVQVSMRYDIQSSPFWLGCFISWFVRKPPFSGSRVSRVPVMQTLGKAALGVELLDAATRCDQLTLYQLVWLE